LKTTFLAFKTGAQTTPYCTLVQYGILIKKGYIGGVSGRPA